jgi:tryptophan halogenase|tara:strand:+ start:53 stop:697 length:645 start_codon:yes stop_codon:yes gene_type:complete
MEDKEALDVLMANVDGEIISKPNFIKFKTGQRVKHWSKNCVAIGLSAGFLEPLESTSIHLIQRAIIRLMQMFPSNGFTDSDRDEFNKQMSDEYEYIRDFIIMHYHVTERDDSAFWRYCRTMDIPATLQHKLDLFLEAGRVFHGEGDVFAENSWTQVMLGQGLTPEQYHPIVNMMSNKELESFLANLKAMVDHSVGQLPSHDVFLSKYCPAPNIA